MKPITIHFRRRYIRLLRVLVYVLVTAWFVWHLAMDTEKEHQDRALASLFFAAFTLHACYLTWRYARFFLQREFIHIDAKGITIWHNDVARMKPLQLSWANITDAWADEYQLHHHNHYLRVIWRTDELELEHLALTLQGAVLYDTNGKAIRGKPLAHRMAALIKKRLPAVRVPLDLAPADIPGGWQKTWFFGTGYNSTGCLAGVVMLALLLFFLLFLAILLFSKFKNTNEFATYLFMTNLFLLLLFGLIRITYDSLMHWLYGVWGRRFIRIDHVGVHYWRYGMMQGSEATIPWEMIHAVSAECEYMRNHWFCSLHLTYAPYASAHYLQHIEYDTGSDKKKTEEAAANIRLHCPNLYQFARLPRVTLPNAIGNAKG